MIESILVLIIAGGFAYGVHWCGVEMLTGKWCLLCVLFILGEIVGYLNGRVVAQNEEE
jgi:hypothetical protein